VIIIIIIIIILNIIIIIHIENFQIINELRLLYSIFSGLQMEFAHFCAQRRVFVYLNVRLLGIRILRWISYLRICAC
jgi:hypothetical protein